MSLPSYPKYKPSGVDWLGDVPEHWGTPALYMRYSIELGKMLDSAKITGDHAIPYLRNVDVQWAKINLDDLPSMDIREDEYARYTIQAGDLLVCEGGEVGRSAIVPEIDGSFGYQKALHRLRALDHGENTKFMHFTLLWAAKTGVFDLGRSSTIAHLTGEQLRRYRFPKPPPPEQTAIAEFLNRETTKIDALMGEQRRLIELLKEKRQAVISHAVTRGLNPHAPLKPSGIAWLSDVPAHWMVASVRRVVQRIEQGWSPECLGRPADGNEWGVVKSGCVNRGTFVEQENKALPETLEPVPEYEIRSGDVLMSRASGSPELVGSTAYITAVRPKLMLSDKIFRIHPEPIIDRRFFVAVFNSRMMREQIERAISGAEGLANNLPQSAMKSFIVVVPPLDEQAEVVVFLTAETTKLDTLTAEAQRAIDLLQERRSALISATVTGKIDVRSIAASAPAKQLDSP